MHLPFTLLFLCASLVSILGQENTFLLCSDGLDNDQDGWVDCLDSDCVKVANLSCEICNLDGLSFADVLIEYLPGCADIPWNEPEKALGLGDWKSPVDGNALALGEGGSLQLGFTNNVLINSGNEEADLWIFEIGDIVEPCNIYLAPFDEWTQNELLSSSLEKVGEYFAFGGIKGDRKYIDIDGFMPGYQRGQLKFKAVNIIDLPDLDCMATLNPGADIDAICALQSAIFDCKGVLGGNAQLDSCGRCRPLDDPRFNDCRDCNNVIGGPAQIDSCGQCLPFNDPLFNQCDRNQEGPNSIAPTYYLPNAFSPNGDGINECFGVLAARSSSLRITTFNIYNRWGALVFSFENGSNQVADACWDGRIGQEMAPSGLYYYDLTIDHLRQMGTLQLSR